MKTAVIKRLKDLSTEFYEAQIYALIQRWKISIEWNSDNVGKEGCDPLRTSFILIYDTCSCVGNYSCTKKKTLVFVSSSCIYIYIYMCVYTAPHQQDARQGQFYVKFTGLNSEFSFSYTGFHTKVREPSLPYYLPIAGDRRIGFIPYPSVLVQSWNTVSIYIYIYIYIYLLNEHFLLVFKYLQLILYISLARIIVKWALHA